MAKNQQNGQNIIYNYKSRSNTDFGGKVMTK